MEIKKFVDKIRNIGYKKIVFLGILLLLGIFSGTYGGDCYYLSGSYDKMSFIIWIGSIGVIGALKFLIEAQDDIETQDNNNEKSNLFQKLKEKDSFIVFLENYIIVFIVIVFIVFVVRIGVIASLKYSNEPYITGNALIIDKYKFSRRHHSAWIFLLTNGKKIEVSTANVRKPTNKKLVYAANRDDCFNVKYRQNRRVIEVRFIENLGKMSPQECLAYRHTVR